MARYAERTQTSADTPFVRGLFALPHVRGFVREPTEAQIDAALDRSEREGSIVYDGDEPVGHVVLRFPEPWLAEAALVIAAKPRCGIGAYVLDRIVRRAFVELGAHRIYLETTDDNAPMHALLARQGFSHEGTFRLGFRADDGTYKDLRAYGMLATDAAARSIRS